jgi:hypothetical protein
MSKGEIKNRCIETKRENRCIKRGESNGQRGSMSVTMPSMFPSIPKGDIVEILVVIDVNP